MVMKVSDIAGVFKEGARPNRFKVTITGPKSLPNMEFLCRAANQPASTLGEIAVPYQGRVYKIPGDRTFEDWTVTVYNDKDHEIRKQLQKYLHSPTHRGPVQLSTHFLHYTSSLIHHHVCM